MMSESNRLGWGELYAEAMLMVLLVMLRQKWHLIVDSEAAKLSLRPLLFY